MEIIVSITVGVFLTVLGAVLHMLLRLLEREA